VSFQEAATVFSDPLSLVTPNDEHASGEARCHIIRSWAAHRFSMSF
jgi:uncharacterized DUF497 family protein